ncbi:MAG TPA: DoxX-like family protein [Chthonomonadaceae bacterium]|nr:DoxX-like family protein [Chthonomonadaceae bacterium]
MSIYVEIRMHGPMEELWRLTQTPEVHARWDLRFTEIEYLPHPDATLPQRFLYRTRIGFGLAIAGEGETVGSRNDAQGCRTSALKFWSDDYRSLIHEGSGYWQYVPTSDGIRFLTRYDYRTRFGLLGRWVDRLAFRPLMGWATAWSFDRLRLWLERGIDPTLSLVRTLLHTLSRLTLALLWLYQGLIPKLLFRDTGELAILQHSHLFPGLEGRVLTCVGIGEMLFGLALLLCWRSRRLLKLNNLLMIVLTLGALFSQPALFVAPFNPLTLNVAMIGLGLAGLIAGRDLPTARNCRRKPEERS